MSLEIKTNEYLIRTVAVDLTRQAGCLRDSHELVFRRAFKWNDLKENFHGPYPYR